MTSALQAEPPTARRPSSLALRVRLLSGIHAVPLERLHHLAGYASLQGDPDDYFLGWLNLQSEWVPVFDLNCVLCEEATLPGFGTRILVIDATPNAPVARIGLLAAGATDTVDAADPAALPLDLDSFLPMLYSLVPSAPAVAA